MQDYPNGLVDYNYIPYIQYLVISIQKIKKYINWPRKFGSVGYLPPMTIAWLRFNFW